MDVSNHVIFTKEKNPDLFDYLSVHNIPFEYCEGFFYFFDMLESNPHWKVVEKYLNDAGRSYTSELVFRPDELANAEWLKVRSCWYYDYPQPEDKYREITYTTKNWCQECWLGLEQVAPFRFKKAPKWGRRGFLMTNWVYGELFLSEKAKELFEAEKFADISFVEVQNKSGKEIFPDIYQLKIHYHLEHSVCDSRYAPGFSVCPSCGRRKYRSNIKEKLVFHKEVFENAPEIVKTSECFGYESGHPVIIVSQRVYQVIKENRLDRSLVFEPVDLV